LFTTFDKH